MWGRSIRRRGDGEREISGWLLSEYVKLSLHVAIPCWLDLIENSCKWCLYSMVYMFDFWVSLSLHLDRSFAAHFPLHGSLSTDISLMMLNHFPVNQGQSLRFLPSPPLTFPLRIDFARKRTAIASQPSISPAHHLSPNTSPLPSTHLPLPITHKLKKKTQRINSLLKPQRNPIHHQHLHRQQHPRRPPIQQCRPQKTHRTPIIHRRARDIERETRHGLIH